MTTLPADVLAFAIKHADRIASLASAASSDAAAAAAFDAADARLAEGRAKTDAAIAAKYRTTDEESELLTHLRRAARLVQAHRLTDAERSEATRLLKMIAP